MLFSKQIKENRLQKVAKIFFPNRDVILFSFGISLNITYLTKQTNYDILKYTKSKNNYVFSPTSSNTFVLF